jgi:lipopolysaccharide export system permease protein
MHELATRAESTLNVNAMEPGTFYVGEHGDRAIFFAHRDGPRTPARDVFVQLWRGNHIQIIHARLAYKLPQTGAEGARIHLQDAHIYEIGLGNKQDDQILDARDFIINPDKSVDPMPDRSSVTASTAQLAASGSAADVAELQWRLSTPISTLLLGMLGIPMSRAKRQQSKYTKLSAAILVYIGYYMLCTSARTWVQHGAIASFPGIWWVPALLGLFLLATLHGPFRDTGFSGGRA